jgi:hypothetical protein
MACSNNSVKSKPSWHALSTTGPKLLSVWSRTMKDKIKIKIKIKNAQVYPAVYTLNYERIK